MRCYRSMGPIKAISFDLDDTLYENWPIIRKAEQLQLAFLHQAIPQARHTTTADWLAIRHQLLIDHPQLHHDIGQLRKKGIVQLLLNLGVEQTYAQQVSEQAFDIFYQQRIKVTITEQVMALLRKLASRCPLIALSNGNACVKTMGLSDVFEFAIHAGDGDIRQKPYPDMFAAAATRLQLHPSEILHVGDSLKSDVQGALNAGCMAVWFNLDNLPLSSKSSLPHLEIAQLDALNSVL